MISRLIESLQGQSIIINASDPEVVSKARDTYKTVTNHGYIQGKRTPDQVLRDAFHGTIREVGIAKLTDGIINQQEPDFSDRATYGWDLSAYDLKLEIKPQYAGSKYFTIEKKVAKRLFNNREYFDYLLSVVLERISKDEWKVIPSILIQSKHFAKYYENSMYKDWQVIYNVHSYPCIILNEWSKR